MKESIIIVEDEKIVRISLTDALKAEGYTVLPVADGKTALSALEEGEFSLVISDIRLPGASGVDVLKKKFVRIAINPCHHDDGLRQH